MIPTQEASTRTRSPPMTSGSQMAMSNSTYEATAMGKRHDQGGCRWFTSVDVAPTPITKAMRNRTVPQSRSRTMSPFVKPGEPTARADAPADRSAMPCSTTEQVVSRVAHVAAGADVASLIPCADISKCAELRRLRRLRTAEQRPADEQRGNEPERIGEVRDGGEQGGDDAGGVHGALRQGPAEDKVEVGVEDHGAGDEADGDDPRTALKQPDAGDEVQRAQHEGVFNRASQPAGLHTQVAALVAAEDVVVPDGAEGIGVRRDRKGVAVERREHGVWVRE